MQAGLVKNLARVVDCVSFLMYKEHQSEGHMKLMEIPVERLLVRPHDIWANKWFVLTAGDYRSRRYNSMTVGWGAFGTMWGRPFAAIVVRPSRYTYCFAEQYESFTLCAFPEKFRAAVQLLGTKSGRECDKIAEAGLNPVAASKVAAPAFEEAELVVECRKIYYDDIEPRHFVDPTIQENYPQKDYHRMYFGEIVAARGTREYLG